MFLKIMSHTPNRSQADADISKPYEMIEVSSCKFMRDEVEGPDGRRIEYYLHCTVPGELMNRSYIIEGNVYLLNDEGKTIDSFWPA